MGNGQTLLKANRTCRELWLNGLWSLFSMTLLARVVCMIYNSTHKSFAWLSMEKDFHLYLLKSSFIFSMVSRKKTCAFLLYKQSEGNIRNIHFSSLKNYDFLHIIDQYSTYSSVHIVQLTEYRCISETSL